MITIKYINLGGNQLFKKKCQNQFGQGGIPPIRAMPKREGVFPLEGFLNKEIFYHKKIDSTKVQSRNLESVEILEALGPTRY